MANTLTVLKRAQTSFRSTVAIPSKWGGAIEDSAAEAKTKYHVQE
jgi:hypothetical protein